jgi:Flp pilus assembly protein TadG
MSAWAGDKRGAAAVEAALILPVAVGVLGLIAIWAQGLTIQRKVTLAARTITDLVSQQGSLTGGSAGAVNQSTVDALLNNAANVLYPVVNPTSGTNPVTGTNVANMTMVVSEIKVDPSGTTATVQWSEPMPSHGTALPTTPSAVQLPNAVAPAGSYLIMGTVSYAYAPPVIGESVRPYTLQDTIYLAIRQWTSLSLNVGK